MVVFHYEGNICTLQVLYKYCKQDKKKNNPGDDQSAILLCPTDKMGIFLDGYSIFTTINMFMVCLVFWLMLAIGFVDIFYDLLFLGVGMDVESCFQCV